MESFTLDWHKECLKNSKNSEQRLSEDLQNRINNDIRKLNEMAQDNAFRDFQVLCAEAEGKKKYTDKYKRKLWETKYPKKVFYTAKLAEV